MIFGKGMRTATFQFSESGGSLNGPDLFTELPFRGSLSLMCCLQLKGNFGHPGHTLTAEIHCDVDRDGSIAVRAMPRCGELRFSGKGCDEALFSKKKGLFNENGGGIQ